MNKNIGEQDVKTIRNHMDMVMRCHFKLRGEKQFAALVERLKEFVDNLLKMCSEVQAQASRRPFGLGISLTLGTQRIENAILQELFGNDNPNHLRSISKVYEQEVVDRKKAGQRYQGYELIKEVAGFKARVQHLAEKRAEETAKRRASQRTNPFLLSSSFLDMDDFRLGYPEFEAGANPVNLWGGENALSLATVDRLDALRYIVCIAETVT